jgi:hypothetical protein
MKDEKVRVHRCEDRCLCGRVVSRHYAASGQFILCAKLVELSTPLPPRTPEVEAIRTALRSTR